MNNPDAAFNAADLHARGMNALQEGNLQNALDSFSSAHQMDPDNAQYLTSFGFACRMAGEKTQAKILFRRAVALDPNMIIARYQLGNMTLEKALAAQSQEKFKKISVVIPSRLDRHPKTGELWLDRSVRSVLGQTAASNIEIEIVVGVDPGAVPPNHFKNQKNIIFAEAVPKQRKGQAAAINAAMAMASGDVVTMIEDDDVWHPRRLEYGLHLLPHYDFVSSNQLEVDPNDKPIELNDFPTPCGWLMRRSVWDEIGDMDEDYPCHLDTEWLGRLNQAGKKRCHIVDAKVPVPFDKIATERPQLPTLIRWMPPGSSLFRTQEQVPLIMRTAHPGSGMARIRTDPVMMEKSAQEHERMRQKFGYYPW